MQIVLLVLALFALIVGPAMADESCPIKLQEAQTQTLIVAQSRDQYEQRLAQAIRANHELGAVRDRMESELKQAKDKLAALNAPKEEAPKP